MSPDPIRAPELEGAAAWLNVNRPLRLRHELRGKVVLLDFWTYGCINCLHIIPDLARLERKYRDELVVIVVHSVEFTNERVDDHLRRAGVPYGIEHPVASDPDMRIWRNYRSAPGRRRGGHHALHRGHGEPPRPCGRSCDEAGDDGGRPDGRRRGASRPRRLDPAHRSVKTLAGSGRAGHADGPAPAVEFFEPGGLSAAAGRLYVADTNNHAIRIVDLGTRRVETLDVALP